jgi:hypothetical protein
MPGIPTKVARGSADDVSDVTARAVRLAIVSGTARNATWLHMACLFQDDDLSGCRNGDIRLCDHGALDIAAGLREQPRMRRTIRRPLMSGSGRADRIVGPRHGHCFAFGAATPRAANRRLVLGEGEVEPRKQKIDVLEEPDGSHDVPLRVQALGSLQRLVDTAQSGSQDGSRSARSADAKRWYAGGVGGSGFPRLSPHIFRSASCA